MYLDLYLIPPFIWYIFSKDIFDTYIIATTVWALYISRLDFVELLIDMVEDDNISKMENGRYV